MSKNATKCDKGGNFPFCELLGVCYDRRVCFTKLNSGYGFSVSAERKFVAENTL